MADDEFSYVVDPGKKFSAALKDAQEKSVDLTVPLQLIARQWFKSNRAIFALKGKGKYADLSPKYKLLKRRIIGSEYPILEFSGALKESITNPKDSHAISLVINKTGIVLGTSIPYAPHLHFGTNRPMPARPVVMIGAEQTGPDEFNERESLWILEIEKHIAESTKQIGETK